MANTLDDDLSDLSGDESVSSSEISSSGASSADGRQFLESPGPPQDRPSRRGSQADIADKPQPMSPTSAAVHALDGETRTIDAACSCSVLVGVESATQPQTLSVITTLRGQCLRILRVLSHDHPFPGYNLPFPSACSCE
jgi:hypothetical protein